MIYWVFNISCQKMLLLSAIVYSHKLFSQLSFLQTSAMQSQSLFCLGALAHSFPIQHSALCKQTSLSAVLCSPWNGMGCAILSMRDTFVVALSPVSNLTPVAVSLQTLLHSTNDVLADIFCNYLPKCSSYFNTLKHLSGFLVISPISWLLFPMMHQPLHTLSLCIWHSYLQPAKTLDLFSSMLISIMPSISNWIWDAFCRLVFLSSTSIFVFGIAIPSRRTDSI